MEPDPEGENTDTRRQLLERFDVAIGIIGSIFGILSVVGLTLLPSSTAIEKSLILTACSALSLACYVGAGAWHNARRFTIMAVLAGTALAATSALSVATENRKTSTRNKTESGVSTTPQAAQYESSKPSSVYPSVPSIETPVSSTPAPSPSKSQKPVYLTSMQPVSTRFTQGQWRIGSTTYSHSLGAPVDFGATATYRLDGRYRRFKTTFVMTENGKAYEDSVLTIKLDGQDPQERTITPYHPTEVDIDVTGITQMDLKVRSDNWGLLKILGEARLEP